MLQKRDETPRQEVLRKIQRAHEAWDRDHGEALVAVLRTGLPREKTRWTFVTGGWSENEELIDELYRDSLVMALAWVSAERGGRHVFEL